MHYILDQQNTNLNMHHFPFNFKNVCGKYQQFLNELCNTTIKKLQLALHFDVANNKVILNN